MLIAPAFATVPMASPVMPTAILSVAVVLTARGAVFTAVRVSPEGTSGPVTARRARPSARRIPRSGMRPVRRGAWVWCVAWVSSLMAERTTGRKWALLGGPDLHEHVVAALRVGGRADRPLRSSPWPPPPPTPPPTSWTLVCRTPTGARPCGRTRPAAVRSARPPSAAEGAAAAANTAISASRTAQAASGRAAQAAAASERRTERRGRRQRGRERRFQRGRRPVTAVFFLTFAAGHGRLPVSPGLLSPDNTQHRRSLWSPLMPISLWILAALVPELLITCVLLRWLPAKGERWIPAPPFRRSPR